MIPLICVICDIKLGEKETSCLGQGKKEKDASQ